MSNEIVLIEDSTVLELFTKPDGLAAIIQTVREEVEGFTHDFTNAKGIAKTKSMGRRIASFKIKLDGMGKELVSEQKAKTKAVDSNRKAMRDELDALKVIALQPLVEYEEELAEIARELEAIRMAKKTEKEKEEDHSIAIDIDKLRNIEISAQLKLDQEYKEEQDRIAELEREANEKRIANRAVEAERERNRLEREEFEQKVKDDAVKEQAAKEREEFNKKEASRIADQVVQDALDAAKAAKFYADEAVKRAVIESENKALLSEKEKIRLQALRDADVDNRKSVNKAVVTSLMGIAGLSEDDAVRVMKAIVRNQIYNVSITY